MNLSEEFFGEFYASTFSDCLSDIYILVCEKIIVLQNMDPDDVVITSQVHDTSFLKIYSNTLEFIILYILYIKILLIINYQQEFSEHLCARPKGDHGL